MQAILKCGQGLYYAQQAPNPKLHHISSKLLPKYARTAGIIDMFLDFD